MAKNYLDKTGLARVVSKIKALIPSNYAGSNQAGGTANKTASIPFGAVDSTSTNTTFTATIDGITELRDGICVMLRNGVVTSASGWTLNINGLGEKPVYSTMGATSRITTTFNVNYTMLFVYNSTRVSGGCWDMYYGYNAGYTNNIAQGQGYGTCSTAEATKAKTVSITSYALVTYGIVTIKFTNAVPAGATLNITSKGAKAIYYKGAAITDNVIQAGDTVTFMYSTYYHIISIDRANPTKTSELTNDSNFAVDSSYVHTDNNFTTTLKNKLDGIAEGANKTTIDTALSTTSTNPVQNKVINTALGNKVDKVSGKGLSTKDFTADYETKLNGVATGAEVNKIDSIKVNGTAQTISSKAVNITVPTSASDINAVPNTGGQITGDVTLYAASGNSPAVIFQRGPLNDNYNDWRIQDRSGHLYFDERGNGSNDWTQRIQLSSSTGDLTLLTGTLKGKAELTGTPTAPTAAAGTNTTQIATTAFVTNVVGDIVSLMEVL